jgi:plasmid stabilization system protein ParE
MKVRALDDAQAEYLDRLRYYRNIDRDLARGFRDEFRQQLAQARRFPESFPRLPRTRDFHVHRCLLDRFEHVIVFALLDDEIVIIAVHHQRRKPGYWKPRLAKVRT